MEQISNSLGDRFKSRLCYTEFSFDGEVIRAVIFSPKTCPTTICESSDISDISIFDFFKVVTTHIL